MMRLVPWIVGLVLTVGSGLVVYQVVAAEPQRPDCPGTIQCPITDEIICQDQCPVK